MNDTTDEFVLYFAYRKWEADNLLRDCVNILRQRRKCMKYRRKIEIEAFQYDGDMMGSDGKYYVPAWAVKALEDGKLYFDSVDGGAPCQLFLKTLTGNRRIDVGDFIVQDVLGEIYACKSDIFKRTYEQVQ